MNIHKSIRFIALLVCIFFMSPRVMAIDIIQGETPQPGTFYLYNLRKGQYLTVVDSTLALTDIGKTVTLTLSDAATGSYTLTMEGRQIYTTFGGGFLVGTPTGDDVQAQWMLKPVPATVTGEQPRVYALGCRDDAAGAMAYLYQSDATGAIGKSYTEAISGQWMLRREDTELIFTLDEDKEVYSPPHLKTGQKVTVHLKRKLYKDQWNTLCLPFTVEEDQLKAQLGEGVRVVEFSGCEESTLRFAEQAETKRLLAGTPYLVRPTQVLADGQEYYEFTGVGSFVVKPTVVTAGGVSFISSFSKTQAPAHTWVINNNEVRLLGKATTMKGTRAYFQRQSSSPSQSPLLRWVISGEATDIAEVLRQGVPVDIYDLQGMLVRWQATSAEGLPKGLYMVNGQKVIVK